VACGDREAFDQVYAAFAGPVFGLSRRILRDPAQAEEVAQEVLLEVWRTASPTQNSPERAHRAHPPAATRQLPPAADGEFADRGPGQGAAATHHPTLTEIGDAPSRRRTRRAAWAGWAAAAALAGVAAGLGVHAENQQRQIQHLSAQAGIAQQLLSAPDAHSGAGLLRTGGHAFVL